MINTLIVIFIVGVACYGAYSIGYSRGVKSQIPVIENLKKRYNKIRREYMAATRPHG